MPIKHIHISFVTLSLLPMTPRWQFYFLSQLAIAMQKELQYYRRYDSFKEQFFKTLCNFLIFIVRPNLRLLLVQQIKVSFSLTNEWDSRETQIKNYQMFHSQTRWQWRFLNLKDKSIQSICADLHPPWLRQRLTHTHLSQPPVRVWSYNLNPEKD